MVFGLAAALERGIPTATVVAATRRSDTCAALLSPASPDRRLLQFAGWPGCS